MKNTSTVRHIIPLGISGFYTYKSGSPPNLPLSKYNRWLYALQREENFIIQGSFECSSVKNYHYINIEYKTYSKSLFYTILCNCHYPYIAFIKLDGEPYMPRNFMDLPKLASKLKSTFGIKILLAKELNSPIDLNLHNCQDEDLAYNLKYWGNTLGGIFFNDWD